jgi:uncharacterized protein (DUF608 family)
VNDKAQPYSATKLYDDKKQRTFTAPNLLQIALPMGGIGTGCICLDGHGGLQDFAIRNQPATTSTQDGHGFTDTAFAVLHIKGKNPITRLVEGPLPQEKIYDQGLKGQGHRSSGHEGLPRFKNCTFKGEYPFGQVKLSDPDIPLKVRITGFNPFIPLDDKNSGLPCAILEYTLKNETKKSVVYEFSYHLSHLAAGMDREQTNTRNENIPGAGIFFYNTDHPNDPTFGSASLTVVGHEPAIKAMWFRGGWFDAISTLWREVSTGQFKPNDGTNGANVKGRNGGSIMLAGSLKPGEAITYPIVITWYFPNVDYSWGAVQSTAETSNTMATCDCGPGGCDSEVPSPLWRPYYASQWRDARDVAAYVGQHYDSLRHRTHAFHDALFATTVPAYVLDAISANLDIIKSPTVLRQANGNLWAWEGCFVDRGCCPGSCTHVWNYAQAIPHLFPQLERTFREQELMRSMDEHGHVTFRAALPDSPPKHDFHAAADGQLGGIMKLYRDWQISGDREWLKTMYPLAKRSLDYCIETWDPQHKGILEEPHHNTYDIEFWGPDGMCSSIYLGALVAMAAIAHDVEQPDEAPFYQELAAKGAAYLDTELFNGEYYEQKVTYEGLQDTSFAELVAQVNEDSGEVEKLLSSEGPKYQYGSGCISDGVIGAWMAKIYGLETPQTQANIRKNLQTIFSYNFKESLWEHANPQRPGYALGDEPGLLLCTWPKGGKPTLPFVYSDEVWTGIEYQVASHLIEEGFIDEGLTIVKALRSRYDGSVRNPWNEYECGNYYARAMASYALLGALSGFRYSAAQKTLWFGPKLPLKKFKSFFSTATGYGTITLSKNKLRLDLLEGHLAVDTLYLTRGKKTRQIDWGVVARAGEKTVLQNVKTYF